MDRRAVLAISEQGAILGYKAVDWALSNCGRAIRARRAGSPGWASPADAWPVSGFLP